MTDNIGNTSDQRLRYKSPEINGIFVEMLGILCQSSNEPIREVDYGDGGFENEY